MQKLFGIFTKIDPKTLRSGPRKRRKDPLGDPYRVVAQSITWADFFFQNPPSLIALHN